MCIGIIKNNSLVGGRARAEARTLATERVTLYCTWRPSALTLGHMGRLEWKLTLLDLFMLHKVVTLAIELITGRFIKFHKIARKQVNSAARLEIPQPAKNCGPY